MYFFFFDDSSLRSHLAPYAYRRRKPSTYGTFKKDVIRYATKGNYKIHDYGTHEFHRILIDCGLKNLCPAHFLELSDYKDAVWAKLNFENIMNANKGTQMLGLYGPINLEPMVDAREIYLAASKRYQELLSTRSTLDNLGKAFNSFETLINQTNAPFRLPLISDDVKDSYVVTKAHAQANIDELNRLMSMEQQKMQDAKNTLTAYVNSIRLS